MQFSSSSSKRSSASRHADSSVCRRPASPEKRGCRMDGADRRRGSDDDDDAKCRQPSKRRRQKRFAWMDSADEDEAEASVESASSCGEECGSELKPRSARTAPSTVADIPLPISATEVQTLAQMMKLMSSFQRGKLLRMSLVELAAILQAAARVRYYDGATFADVNAAVKVHLRARGGCNSEDIAAVVTALADLNAYDKDLFEEAANTLNRSDGQLDPTWRRRILDAFKKVGHQTDLPILHFLSQQEKAARYEAAREEVAASWQKPGTLLRLGIKH